MITFDGVWCRRGTRDVLNDVSFTVLEGDTLALVGRSGAGKSTALKLVNRMLVSDRGLVSVAGRNVLELDPIALRRQTGYVLQEVGLFPHMTVARNVAVVPTLLQWPTDRIEARVAELLNLVGLPASDYATRWPHELSGGQRQRVGVARALAADPPVLLMDEPFGALDPVTRVELHAEFRGIQSRLRKTIVLVTHDMQEACALATRIGVLHEGRLVALDTPEGLRSSREAAVRTLFDAMFDGRVPALPGMGEI
ncbi:MAG: ATP-binding cassette domain-containing protein [Vicinamibacterales bacterium]